MRVRLSLTSTRAEWRGACFAMSAGNCSWAARSGSRGSPWGQRPASDEIMRARLALTSARPRRMARGVFLLCLPETALGRHDRAAGEPEGARPASDEIMRVRLSLTSRAREWRGACFSDKSKWIRPCPSDFGRRAVLSADRTKTHAFFQLSAAIRAVPLLFQLCAAGGAELAVLAMDGAAAVRAESARRFRRHRRSGFIGMKHLEDGVHCNIRHFLADEHPPAHRVPV